MLLGLTLARSLVLGYLPSVAEVATVPGFFIMVVLEEDADAEAVGRASKEAVPPLLLLLLLGDCSLLSPEDTNPAEDPLDEGRSTLLILLLWLLLLLLLLSHPMTPCRRRTVCSFTCTKTSSALV